MRAACTKSWGQRAANMKLPGRQSINQSINQSTNQPTNQAIIQSTKQSFNQSSFNVGSRPSQKVCCHHTRNSQNALHLPVWMSTCLLKRGSAYASLVLGVDKGYVSHPAVSLASCMPCTNSVPNQSSEDPEC